MIGQSISSYGYGIGIGDNINGVNAGDTIIGTNIITDSGSNGKLSWRSTSRSIFGRYLQGYFTYDASVFGSYISAFSGTIPNRTNWYTYGIGSDALVIGSHIKGSVGAGSILIGQNSSPDAAYASYNWQAIVPIVVTSDSMVFGGYSHDYNQSAYYRNPGISASYNGIILGQGQQMSATNDSIIVGNQSIAQYGSKVFGSHGYANNASMVLNPSPMTFQPQTITGYFLNGLLLSSAPEIYGSNTAFGLYKQTSNGYVIEKCDLSGTLKLEMPTNNNTCQAYFSYIHKSLSDNENGSFVALNVKKDDTWLSYAKGYWNNDRTIFTPDNNYGNNAGIIIWTKGAILLIKENGVKKIYEYNEETSGTVNFPKYFYIQYNAYYPYSFVALGNGNNSRSNKITPNILNGNVVTDGEYIYYIPINQWDFYSTREFSIPNNLIPTSFSGSIGLKASAAYFNTDEDIDLIYPSNIIAYGYKGQTGQISSGTSSIYPSAIYSEVSSMITNTTADCGSIAIGYKNSAYCGSVAINTQSYYLDNYSYTAQHSIGYNLDNSSKIITNYKVNSSASITSQNDITLNSYNIEGFTKSANAFNKAGYGSVSIAVGGDDYDTFENKKEKYGNISYNGSMIIGLNSSAYDGSYIIGKSKYAYDDAIAIGPNGNDYVNYKSMSLGFNNTASNNSIAIGFNNQTQTNSYFLGYKGGNIHDNGFGMGFNIQSYSMGWNIGYNSYTYGNGFNLGYNNYADCQGWSVGYNNNAHYNGFAIGFNLNVQQDGFSFGFNNQAQYQSYVIGFNNTGYYETFILGDYNYGTNNDILIGRSNADYANSYNPSPSEKVTLFGRYNQIVQTGYTPSGDLNKNYDIVMLGHNNHLIYGVNDESRGFAFDGIMLGNDNHNYITDFGDPGGYNIYIGRGNKGILEAINIGSNNDTMGHSIALGWQNKAVKGGNAHSILIGNLNTSKNTQGYIYNKSYPVILQTILTDEQIRQINADITSLTAQRETAYANSAAKRMDLYNLLTANGMDAVSAENYLNGAIYNSGNGQSYVYPKNPWTIESYPYGYDYIDGGNLTTGYGESGFVRAWICNTSSYSSNSTSNYNYKYYWLPAKQASAIWSQVSSIYKNEYGSNSGNRYNELNDSIAIINNIQSQIYSKQNELTKNPITGTSSTDTHNIETMSFVVGQGNSADHHNSIVIGSENHTLKQVDGYYSDDDGFTVAIGLGNTVVRNYDMAIGYGAIASGGENIAIGVPYQYVDNDYNYYSNVYPSAVGVRNFSLNGCVTGHDNIALKSYVLGTGVSANSSYNSNFQRNILFDSLPIINGSGASNAQAINNNIFNDVRSTNLNISYVFDRNDLRVLHKSTIQSNTACDNRYREVLSSNIITNQDCYNTYENVISSTIVTSGWCNSFSVFKNVSQMYFTANSTAGSNLFYDIGGYSPSWNNRINFSALGTFAHNIIMNAGLNGKVTSWTGICNNFFWKSYVEPFYADERGLKQYNGYGDAFCENMLIGTEAYNTVMESFSFGGHGGSQEHYTQSGKDSNYSPVLRDCVRIWNFGDNIIQHAADTFVGGDSNEINGADRFNVLGANNYVKARIDDNTDSVWNSTPFHDSTIIGNVNAIATYISNYQGYNNTKNYIFGHLNTIIAGTGTNNNNYNDNLRIIGDCNHFAGINTNTINSVINGVSGGSIYTWTITAQNSSNGEISSYDSIIPVKNSNYSEAAQQVSSYSAYPIHGAARNTIIGSKSVISNDITDSISLGHYNAIYQDEQPNQLKFNDINIIGAFNLGINGSHQFNVGFNNITSGHHSTAIGEELRANAFQTILGKYNTSAEGTTRTTMRWNSATNTVEQVENTGVLLAVGNGRLNLYEKYTKINNYNSAYYWYDVNGNKVDERYITTDNYIQRSNAMIVSADGTVSARRFIESEPALTITGGDFVTVTEDTTNNKLVIDLESSLGQMLTELSGALTTKPSTGRHILGVDDGTLTWLEVNQ